MSLKVLFEDDPFDQSEGPVRLRIEFRCDVCSKPIAKEEGGYAEIHPKGDVGWFAHDACRIRLMVGLHEQHIRTVSVPMWAYAKAWATPWRPDLGGKHRVRPKVAEPTGVA